jgi:RNA polymerase sigma factor (sigma-70 family)
MKDDDIITGITGSDQEREAALRYVFQRSGWQAAVVSLVQQYGGNAQDGEDVFMETIVAFDRNIRSGKFESKSSLKTYFLAIAKKLWWKKRKKQRPEEEIAPQHYDDALPSVEDLAIADEQKEYHRRMLGMLGRRCQELLKLSHLGYAMAEIAQTIGLSSPEAAKKEVYRCRLRMRKFIDDHPEWGDLIK